MLKCFCAASLIASAALLSTSASALTVTYEWVNVGTSNGSGYITLNSPLITNPATFGSPTSGPPQSAVVDLAYKWTNGSNTKSITETDVTFWQIPFGFSALNGFLTTQFNASDFPTNSFSLQGAAYPANSLNSLAAPFTDADSGYWRLQEIPEPGSALLLALGLTGIASLAWSRRRRS